MRILTLFLLVIIVPFSFSMADVTYASGDPYADSVYQHSTIGIDDPEECLGAPDGQTGIIAGVNNYVALDMGSGEEGTGVLKVYFGPLSVGSVFTVWFLADNLGTIKSYTEDIQYSVGSTTRAYSFDADVEGEHYRYVKITSGTSLGLPVDAVEALEYEGQ